MNEAIKLILEQNDNKAGDYDIEFEAFDDSTAAAGKWDEAKCAENGNTYADDDSIVGVIGTYNSGCAAIIIPIVNEVGLAMVSPANTYPGLTTSRPGHRAGRARQVLPVRHPQLLARRRERLVPGQGRRVVHEGRPRRHEGLHPRRQGAVREGRRRRLRGFGKDVGLQVVGHEGWDKDAPNYTALMTKIKASGADGIFIGGVSTNNGGQLVKDKVSVVGNNEDVKLMVADGFVLSTLFDEAGAANVNGAFGSAPTKPPEQITGAGKEFFDAFEPKIPEGQTIQVYTIYAAAAAQVLLEAIADSDGTREDITAKMFEVSIPDSVVGPLEFDENGDPTAGTESIYSATNGNWEWKEEKAVT